MHGPRKLRIIFIKPSKYDREGSVERFRWGFMPNSTLAYLRSMTPSEFGGTQIEAITIDEHTWTDLGYLDLLRAGDCPTLLALVGVQSHQFPRALDLAALARKRGVGHCILGGPHPMTCDTSMFHGRGVSFALAEAEVVWPTIVRDAIRGGLQPIYGEDQRWAQELQSPVLIPPNARDLRRNIVPMMGIYPARGCPFTCNFCSVIKIAGRRVRTQAIETTLQSLLAAKRAGIKVIMFTSDNFNKYTEAKELLGAMIDAKLNLPFFVQCDTQITRDEGLVALLAKAGCWEMFVGVESFDRAILVAAKKYQNKPAHYAEIVRLCEEYGIESHFSNIIGFPEQNAPAILDHLSVLRKMQPSQASFYILTPIPGTEQYDTFRAGGLLTETDLGHCDATSLVWRHPHLSAAELTDLLFRCYREFYALPDVFRKAFKKRATRRPWYLRGLEVGFPLFSRFAVRRGMHPMSGGIGRVRRDAVRDYIAFRKERFGVELVPLPASLGVPEGELKANRPGSPRPVVMAS